MKAVGEFLAPCRRPLRLPCVVMWNVECLIGMCRLTCGEISGVTGYVIILSKHFEGNDMVKFKRRSKLSVKKNLLVCFVDGVVSPQGGMNVGV